MSVSVQSGILHVSRLLNATVHARVQGSVQLRNYAFRSYVGKQVCKEISKELGQKVCKKSTCSKELGKKVCKENSKELGKKVCKNCSRELGKNGCKKTRNEVGK